MNTYEKLTDAKEQSNSQLNKIGEIRKDLYLDSRRFLSGCGSSCAIVPNQLVAEFDDLLDRIEAYHRQEIENIDKQLDAVETLLAGYAAKEQQK